MLDARPPLDERELAALRAALGAAGTEGPSDRPEYASAWRRAAAFESTLADDGAFEESYVLSPRSTRGATRA